MREVGVRKKQTMPPMLTTRAPTAMWSYLAFLAHHPVLQVGGKLQEFLSRMAVEFLLVERPWERGFKIRQAISIGDAPGMSSTAVKGIVQVNVAFQGVARPDGTAISGEELRELFQTTAEFLKENDYTAVSSTQRIGGLPRLGKVTTASLVYSFLYWAALVRFPPGQPLVPIAQYGAQMDKRAQR